MVTAFFCFSTLFCVGLEIIFWWIMKIGFVSELGMPWFFARRLVVYPSSGVVFWSAKLQCPACAKPLPAEAVR
ncbi:MAG: hypothetical protein ORN28_02700 [Rhodoferax sp.]|nr:hypothetical protein [Rhodoferax sp.]